MYLTNGEISSIQLYLETIIDDLNQVEWFEISLEYTIQLFSDLIARPWMIHPFREGNTRTVMRFAGLFAKAKGFPSNSKLFRDHANYEKKSLVLYCFEEAPEKDCFLQIMTDAINDF